MKSVIAGAAALVLTASAVVGATPALAGPGEGHTPTVVCHWVPAHGGSYIEIVVDDDAANGNRNLRAHAHHENDIINPLSGSCGGEIED